MMQLTQKESTLLKDLKDQEQLCVEKYAKHAACAKDVQLKNLFNELSQAEQKHLNTLVQVENGTVPAPGATAAQQPTFTETYSIADTPDKENDSYLCADLLTAEKHASHLYDTCVFEFKDQNLRQVLNHIQTEEQGHGKAIYDYMAANNMYN
jgi:rubrerythrin